MYAPIWVRNKQVLHIHKITIMHQGGTTGVRDIGLLDSALVRPENSFYYEHNNDVVNLAAIYAEAIVFNHPFVDGNKRTGYLTASFFLQINGYTLNISSVDESAKLFEELAEKKITSQEFFTRFAKYVSKT